jgi:aryl-alcohol dehydrogenase-like predicted oxidoreductase
MPHLLQGECVEAMELLQKQGKIRYWGLSLNTFEPFEEARYLMEGNKGQGFQLVLNVINQKALPLIKEAGGKGYGIIARMPLQFGLLTGKFDKQAAFTGNDHRKNRLTAAVIEKTKEATAPVWELCEKYQCTKTALALSYILSYPEVSVAIPGIRTPEQATANTGGLFRLDIADRSMIESLGTASFPALMELIRAQG